MASSKDRLAFRSGFQQNSALVEQCLGRVVGWRLFSPRMTCLGRPSLPYARIGGLYGKPPIK